MKIKKILLFLILINLVNADSGYIPINIINQNKYVYCEIGKPCDYINDFNIPKQINFLPIIGIFVFVIFISFISLYFISKKIAGKTI